MPRSANLGWIIDVGGGNGSLLLAILERHPASVKAVVHRKGASQIRCVSAVYFATVTEYASRPLLDARLTVDADIS